MANSKDVEESYWNDLVSEPVNIHKDVVSPERSATNLVEQEEVPETKDGLSDLESSPEVVIPLHESMDVDSDISHTVAESWAESMDDVGICERDETRAERQDNIHENHTSRQYPHGSRDNWRPRGTHLYHDRWNQSRACNWRGSRGRGFRGRGLRNRDFRSRGFTFRGTRRPYQHPQRFIPRGPSTWRSQIRYDEYSLASVRGRARRNWDQDRGHQQQRSDTGQ